MSSNADIVPEYSVAIHPSLLLGNPPPVPTTSIPPLLTTDRTNTSILDHTTTNTSTLDHTTTNTSTLDHTTTNTSTLYHATRPNTAVKSAPTPRIPVSLIQDIPDKQGSKSLRGFYEYLSDIVIRDELAALKFATKHKLLAKRLSCKFCKVFFVEEMGRTSHKTRHLLSTKKLLRKKTQTTDPTSLRCPGSCKRRRSVKSGSVFQSSPLPLTTIFRILGFWCVGYNQQITARLVSATPAQVHAWYTLTQQVCRSKLEQYGVPCKQYNNHEVEIIWKHIFGTCIADQQSQTHWVRLITHVAEINPPATTI